MACYFVVPMPELEKFIEDSRVPDCDCGCIVCCCEEARKHKKTCRRRISMTCIVPIECEHGKYVCDICDTCDCGGVP